MSDVIDFESQFADVLIAAGFNPPTIVADGSFQRFDGPEDRRGKKNGWCVLNVAGDVAWGAFGDWKTDREERWCSKAENDMTEHERKAHRQRVQETRAAVAAAREAKAAEARALVARQWEPSGGVRSDHPYVVKKAIRPRGAKQQRDQLLIPLRDIDGALHSMQYIGSDGSKQFKSGGRIAGCFCMVGDEPKDGDVLLVAEGWATACSLHQATGYTVFAAMYAGNLLAVSKAVLSRYPAARIIAAADDDYQTEGNPGQTKALEAAFAVGGAVAVPDFGPDRPAGATDYNDLHVHAGLVAVRGCIAVAVASLEATATGADVREFPWAAAKQPNQVSAEGGSKEESDDEVIERLAALKPLQYDRVRKSEAKRMGVQVSTLDKLVEGTRSEESDDADGPFSDVEPWHERVDGAVLLSDLVAVVRRFIICDEATAHATALWITMTWVMDAVDVAPIAAITAPEKRCGKSQLLFLMGRLSSRPLTASNISPAALFRAIEAWKPTLLIDEADAFMKENEELRGLLNCGHTRDSAYVIRTVGEDYTPKQFVVWGAKAIAGIGHLADTVMDRSIALELRRKLPHEQVDKLRHAEAGMFERLCAKLARWSDDNAEAVRVARPDLPDSLHDRAADNWEPLLQIAAVVGGAWPETARRAAVALSGDAAAAQSTGVELLADIQEVFETRRVMRISSADLLQALCDDGEKAWATWNRGKAMSLKQLAKRLGEYGIKSKNVRSGYSVSKGYDRSQFDETFSRYLHTPDFPATPLQPNNDGPQSVADDPLRSGTETASATPEPLSHKDCSGVADETGKTAGGGNFVAGDDGEDGI
jgi:putative DNA primase/helicase